MTEILFIQGEDYLIGGSDLLLTCDRDSNHEFRLLVEKIRKSVNDNHFIIPTGSIKGSTLFTLSNLPLEELLQTDIQSFQAHDDFDLFVIDREDSQLYLSINGNKNMQEYSSGRLVKYQGKTFISHIIYQYIVNEDPTLSFINDRNLNETASMVRRWFTEISKNNVNVEGHGIYIFDRGNFRVFSVSQKTSLTTIDTYIRTFPKVFSESMVYMFKTSNI